MRASRAPCVVAVLSPFPVVPIHADRVGFETLLSDVSARLIAADAAAIRGVVTSAVERVRRFFQADRCALLSVNRERGDACVTHASCADPAWAVPTDLNCAALFPWCWQQLAVRHEPVVLARITDLPPEADADRAAFAGMRMRSSLSLPIDVDATRLHLIVVHTCREERTWPAEYIPRLRLLGEVLVKSIERAATVEALEAREHRLEEAAAAAHCGMWELDIATGSIWLTPEARRLHAVAAEGPIDYGRFVAQVHPDERDRVVAAIAQTMSSACRFDQTYRILRRSGEVRWVHATARVAHGTILLGASIDVTEQTLQEQELRNALEDVQRLRGQLERENLYLRKEATGRIAPKRLVGRGDAMLRTLALTEQVARTDATVLLLGETGSGKERFASYIHECSRRRDRPMIRVNCSAIPTALIESELFGREKGAYTGALSRQVGRFELAHESTIFLDEIGELPLEVQVKLLRVIEQRTVERLGNPRPVAVDVRIVAATNRDLAASVRDGRFREDLFYRLDVFPITVPSLRERVEDIPLLAEAFVEELGRTIGKRVDRIDPASMAAMAAYRWPGNVRELRNVIERAMIMMKGTTLSVELPGGALPPAGIPTGSGASERSHLLGVLQDSGWRIRGLHGAAARLGLKPTTLESRLKRLGLRRPGAS